MRMGWGTLACGLIVGAAAGFVCGHVAAWTHASQRPPQLKPVAALPALSGGFELALPLEPDLEPDGPVFFPQHLHPESGVNEPVHADAELAAGHAPKADASGHEPAALPEPAEATPLSDDEDRTLKAILDSELAHLSPADRDVWLDVLEGLPPADALGIVRLWKRFGSGPGLAVDTHHANALPETFTPSILAPTPTTPLPFSDGGVSARSTHTNLHDARKLVHQNLLSAETYGFRRFDPVFAIPSAANLSGAGVDANVSVPPPTLQMITSRIDHSMGTVVNTASPLDLAIDGDGFFVVTHPDEGEFYTRCGRFSRDDEGRLSLLTSRGHLAVTPEIRIPADCAAVMVASDGDVSIHRGADAWEKIGTISLALFVSPAQLAASNDALFKPGEQSGTPQLGRANDGLRGSLVQRALECSNVDVEGEKRLLRQIDEWLQTIQPHSNSPAGQF